MTTPCYDLWIVFVLLTGAADQAQQERYVESAQQLTVGMSHDEVLAVMGPPTIDYSKTTLYNHWMYGISVDPELIVLPGMPIKNPLPFRLRIFRYHTDDVVVRWGTDNQLKQVNRLDRFESSEVGRVILDIEDFLDTFFQLLALANK